MLFQQEGGKANLSIAILLWNPGANLMYNNSEKEKEVCVNVEKKQILKRWECVSISAFLWLAVKCDNFLDNFRGFSQCHFSFLGWVSYVWRTPGTFSHVQLLRISYFMRSQRLRKTIFALSLMSFELFFFHWEIAKILRGNYMLVRKAFIFCAIIPKTFPYKKLLNCQLVKHKKILCLISEKTWYIL